MTDRTRQSSQNLQSLDASSFWRGTFSAPPALHAEATAGHRVPLILRVGRPALFRMGCFSNPLKSVTRKEAALQATPFFAAVSGDAGSLLLRELAVSATMRRVPVGKNLDDVPHGTFVVVVEGELAHTQDGVHGKGAAKSDVRVAPRGDEPDATMAVRRVGDFFRLAAMGGGGKAAKLADLSHIAATQRSLILLMTPAALTRALGAAEGKQALGDSSFAEVLKEMLKSDITALVGRVPCFAPLDARARYTLAQLFSYDVVPPVPWARASFVLGPWLVHVVAFVVSVWGAACVLPLCAGRCRAVSLRVC